MSEEYNNTISLKLQKEQINRILDLEPSIEPQNAAQTSVLLLNSQGNFELPDGKRLFCVIYRATFVFYVNFQNIKT